MLADNFSFLFFFFSVVVIAIIKYHKSINIFKQKTNNFFYTHYALTFILVFCNRIRLPLKALHSIIIKQSKR